MATRNEEDFPPGHPARFDYNPESPEAKEWARRNIFPKGERDFPLDHPKAIDTEGNTNSLPVRAGVDPFNPDREEFTGRTPEQAAAAREVYAQMSRAAMESPVFTPTIALEPAKSTNEPRVMAESDGSGYTIFCPGCKCGHKFDSRWQFNGSMELPTFTPSMDVNRDDPKTHCHSVVTNGRIQFLSDSAHSLSGQTVDLPTISQMKGTIHA